MVKVAVAGVPPPVLVAIIVTTVSAVTAFAGIVTVIVPPLATPVQEPPSVPSFTPLPSVPPPAPLSLNATFGVPDVTV